MREGARRLLQTALDNEVAEVIGRFSNVIHDQGRRIVVRNGNLPQREPVTGAGSVTVKQPRVRDRSGQFTSRILPPFLRRIPSADVLLPVLYLKGVSTGDFSEALAAIMGPNASSGPRSNGVIDTMASDNRLRLTGFGVDGPAGALLNQLRQGAKNFPIPEGLGRVVNPDGSFSEATHARLVPSGSGVKTAFPLTPEEE